MGASHDGKLELPAPRSEADSRADSSPKFVATAARLNVASAGRHPGSGYPEPETLSRQEARHQDHDNKREDGSHESDQWVAT